MTASFCLLTKSGNRGESVTDFMNDLRTQRVWLSILDEADLSAGDAVTELLQCRLFLQSSQNTGLSDTQITLICREV